MNWYKIAQAPFHVDVDEVEHPEEIPTYQKRPGYQNIHKNIHEKASEQIMQMFPNAKPIGAGLYGIAYDLGSMILKLTSDQSEIIFANRFKQNPYDRIAKIYDVMFIDDNIYGIIMEKVKLLTKEQIARLNSKSTTISSLVTNSPDPVLHLLTVDELDKAEDPVYDTKDELFIEYYELLQELYDTEQGFRPFDARPENIGHNKNGNLVLFDVGFTDLLDEIQDLNSKEKFKKKHKKAQ